MIDFKEYCIDFQNLPRERDNEFVREIKRIGLFYFKQINLYYMLG